VQLPKLSYYYYPKIPSVFPSALAEYLFAHTLKLRLLKIFRPFVKPIVVVTSSVTLVAFMTSGVTSSRCLSTGMLVVGLGGGGAHRDLGKIILSQNNYNNKQIALTLNYM
jgi:hypothetical protein